MKLIRGPVGKAPNGWKAVYDAIKEERGRVEAPVDIEGAEQLAEQSTSQETSHFQTLVGLMLSSQTKDPVTAAAMGRLKDHGLSVQSMREIKEGKLAELIYPVSFYRMKAKHIKKTAEMLQEKHDGAVPDSIDELLELPGVGPKMGYLCLNICFHKIDGIAVDTHVHRICNRLGWVQSKKPEETRMQLQGWLPKEHWGEVNITLVGWGQTVCKPVKPQCENCPVKDECPTGRSAKKTKPKSS